ncbi:amidase [Nitriliruptoraceae bacterium ZYF776]|nr:amidase [Profundirhabdus halotolerans]
MSAPSSPTTPADTVGRTAHEIAGAVREGRVAAVEVVRAHLAHLAEVEHRLGAYVTVLRREALEDAARVDRHPDRGSLPLAGVPVAVKDVVDVAGHATNHGSRALPGRIARADDPTVAALRAAGACIVGKTRCPELSIWGTSDDVDGVAVSPWQPGRSAGGSSGGSGAAVAAGTVPLALASDGLGSVRIPAAATGTFGIKPGAGLLPVATSAGEPHWFGMSRFGPIATSVADAALGLSVLAGRPDLAVVRHPDQRLRVAVSVVPPAAGVLVGRAWVEAAVEAGRLLRHAGHEVHRADPPYEVATMAAVVARWTQGAALDVADLEADPTALQPRTRGHAAAGRRLARVLPVRDEQARRWRERVAPFLAEHDVLVTPMFAKAQPGGVTWHRRGWTANVVSNLAAYPFAAAWNLADVPAASVPVGADAGRPTAVQLVAAPGREDLLLSVAAQLEALSPWTRQPAGWGVPRTA